MAQDRAGGEGVTTTCQPSNKYGAVTTSSGGHTFDSKIEERRYWHLKADPTVKEIEVHPTYPIFPETRKCLKCGEKFSEKIGNCPKCKRKLIVFRGISYIPDFRVTYLDGHVDIEDVKGVETEGFRLKRKLFEAAYPALTLSIVRRSGKNWLVSTGADRK